MAVMTVSTPQASQPYQSSISTQDGIIPVTPSQTLRNRTSLKTLLANSASRGNSTRSPPPTVVPPARNVPFVPPPPPPPLSMGSPSDSPRFGNQVESTMALSTSQSNLPPTTPLGTRGGSISATSSPVRPTPRFHVANPTEDSTPPPPLSRKLSISKSPDASRPLPTPNAGLGATSSEGVKSDNTSADIASRSPFPPFIHINTSNLRAQPTYYQSSPSTNTTTSPSPFSSVAASSVPTSISPTSSMGCYVAPKPLTRASLPIGPSPMHVPPVLPLADPQITYSGKSTPVSTTMASSATSVSPRGRMRPLPIPPPLPTAPPAPSTSAGLTGPRPRSYSRGPKSRSRANSSAGRGGDANARPQLSFDPTSSSYVIKTSSNANGGSATPSAGSSMKSRRNGPAHTHARSRSAQFNSFSVMGSPSSTTGINSIDIAAALAGVGVGGSAHPTIGGFNSEGSASNANLPSLSAKQKGKLPIRSAPCSDTEDSPAPSPHQTRRFAVTNDTSRPVLSEKRRGKLPVRSAPSSDTEDFTPASIFLNSKGKGREAAGAATSGHPVSGWNGEKKDFGIGKRSESVGSISRAPYSTSQHPHPLPHSNKQLSIITDFSSAKLATSAPQSAHAAYSNQTWVPPQEIHVQPLNIVRRTATPPNTSTGANNVNGITKVICDSPPPSIANATTVHTVEEDTEDDIGHADTGYIDDDRVYIDDGFDGTGGMLDLDLGDIGEITFSTNPPSPIWVDSTTDEGVYRGRVKGRGRHVSTRRLGSYDSGIYDGQQGDESGDVRHSHSVDMQEEERARQSKNGNQNGRTMTSPVGYDSVNADIELEGEMIFSKNQSPVTGLVGERVFMRGKWRSPSPPTPVMRQRGGGDLMPVRPRHFFEDSSRH